MSKGVRKPFSKTERCHALMTMYQTWIILGEVKMAEKIMNDLDQEAKQYYAIQKQ